MRKRDDQNTSILPHTDLPELPYEVDFCKKRFPTKKYNYRNSIKAPILSYYNSVLKKKWEKFGWEPIFVKSSTKNDRFRRTFSETFNKHPEQSLNICEMLIESANVGFGAGQKRASLVDFENEKREAAK